MKNKFFIIIITYFFLQGVSLSETFKFETKNIEILENGELIYANDGKVFSSDKNLELEAEKFEYKKKLDILNAYNNGSAIMKSENLKIEFDKAVINQKKSTIQATGNVKVYQPDKNLIIESDKIIYNQNSLILQAIDNVKIFQTKKKFSS